MRNFSAFKSGFVFCFRFAFVGAVRLSLKRYFQRKFVFRRRATPRYSARRRLRLLGLFAAFFRPPFLNRFYYPNSQDFCDFEKIIFRKYDKSCRIHKKGIEKGRNTTVKFRTSPLKCRLRPCLYGCNAFRYLSLRRLIVSSLLT